MSLRAVPFLLALSTLGLSRPAQAGRASACKAPPFSVPKETQRAVDAAIDARVVGTGAGAVSSAVETRTDYETTTLSQDAAARSWVEYTLCLKLAKKLISQDLHDELLRGLIAPTAPLAIVNATPVATTAPQPLPDTVGAPATPTPVAITPDQIVGTWQVLSTYSSGSCPERMAGGTYAYAWMVSQDGAGQIVVAVQGNSSFGRLQGSIRDDRIRLGGAKNHDGTPEPEPAGVATDGPQLTVLPRTDFDLRLVDGELVGTREVVSWTSTLSEDNSTYTVLPCVLHYEVQGQRAGYRAEK